MPTALVNAYEVGYETTNYFATDEIVMDGVWSTGTWTYGTEWKRALLEVGTTEPIVPEALTIVAVVLLSSVAVAVSFYLLRKHPKTESHSTVKTKESHTHSKACES